jgi:hypothetical protein
MVPTNPDEPLVDADLAAEIALLGEVIAAAAAAAGPSLSPAEIDAALGLASAEQGEGAAEHGEGGAD